MERYFKPVPKKRAAAAATSENAKRFAAGAAAASAAADTPAAPQADAGHVPGGAASSAPQASYTIATWNCNGLSSRLSTAADLAAFTSFVQREKPDVILLQEVRMAAAGPLGCKVRTLAAEWPVPPLAAARAPSASLCAAPNFGAPSMCSPA